MSRTTTPESSPATPKVKAPKVKAEKASRPATPADPAKAARSAAVLLKQVSDATRIQGLLLLAEGPLNVGSLVKAIGISQPACSHHLSLMRHARLIEPTRHGKNNVYKNTEEGSRLVEAVRILVD